MPSLRDFLQRGQVLTLYRQLLKVAKQLDPVGSGAGVDGGRRSQAMLEVRRNFEVHRGTDSENARFLMNEGTKQLKMLGDIGDDMLARGSAAEGAAGGAAGSWGRVVERPGASAGIASSHGLNAEAGIVGGGPGIDNDRVAGGRDDDDDGDAGWAWSKEYQGGSVVPPRRGGVGGGTDADVSSLGIRRR